jgi:hypothetical protein
MQNFQTAGAQFTVAQPAATLKHCLGLRIWNTLTKVGPGTLNFSNDSITCFAASVFAVNEGIVNFLLAQL